MKKLKYSLGKLEESSRNASIINLNLCRTVAGKFSTLNNELALRMACKLISEEKDIFDADRYVVIGLGESTLLGYLVADHLSKVLHNVEFITTTLKAGYKENVIEVFEDDGNSCFIKVESLRSNAEKTRFIFVTDEIRSSASVYDVIRDIEMLFKKKSISGYDIVSVIKPLELVYDNSEIYKLKINFISLDTVSKSKYDSFEKLMLDISGDSDYTIDDKTLLDIGSLRIMSVDAHKKLYSNSCGKYSIGDESITLDNIKNSLGTVNVDAYYMNYIKDDIAILDILNALEKEVESKDYKRLVIIGTEKFNIIPGEIARYFEERYKNIDVLLHNTTREAILPMVDTSENYVISNRVEIDSAYGEYKTYLYNTKEYTTKDSLIAIITDRNEYIHQLVKHFNEIGADTVLVFSCE